MDSFMLDPRWFIEERARNAKAVVLYCCDKDAKVLKSNDENLLYVSYRLFWTMTKRCENIKEISIPGDLEIEIDTLKEQLPHLENVIIRVNKGANLVEEHRLPANEFRSFFSQRLLVGENGVTTNDLPDRQRRAYNKIVPYLPEVYPNIKKVIVCPDVYGEKLNYKGTSFSPHMEYGIVYIGMEIIQIAKDCIEIK